jgi:hypothetical protein
METASAIRKIHKQAKRPTGRQSGYPQPHPERTAGISTHGFLNQSFLPFWAMTFGDYAETEKQFFQSLTNLLNLYNITHPAMDGVVYPQNVAEAYEYVCDKLKKADSNAECLILRDELHPAVLATIKRYDTRQTLYYIPVHGLWQIINCARLQPLADLLLCICAYLYQVADIPFFRDPSSYLYYEYEIIGDWIDEDEGEIEEEYITEQRNDLAFMADAGDRILQVIAQESTLEQLELRIDAYCHWEQCRKSVVELARDFLALYRQYPKRSIMDNIHPDLFEPEYSEHTRAEQYISFYWSGYDTINDQLFEIINNELQENGSIEEPLSIQLFDTPQGTISDNLDFENRLFGLIDRLCDLLIPYDYAEHQ